jgi:NAD(P) transhydrogenase subunit alpha
MHRVVAESDVVITTALVPGQRAPILVTREMVEAMPHGGVIVDLAAERGGNCELTQPGQTIRHGSITIVGDPNLVSSAAQHASQMYANNVVNLLRHLFSARKGEPAPSQPRLDESDEIVASILVCRDGQVVHPRVRQLMGLEPIQRVPQPTRAAG